MGYKQHHEVQLRFFVSSSLDFNRDSGRIRVTSSSSESYDEAIKQLLHFHKDLGLAIEKEVNSNG